MAKIIPLGKVLGASSLLINWRAKQETRGVNLERECQYIYTQKPKKKIIKKGFWLKMEVFWANIRERRIRREKKTKEKKKRKKGKNSKRKRNSK